MPKGSFVLDKLKKLTPKTKSGNRAYQFHRHLTETGKEALKKVLYTVEALASVSSSKKSFDKLIQEKYGQKELPFTDIDKLDSPKEEPKLSNFDSKLKKALDYNPKKDKKIDEDDDDDLETGVVVLK